jgi:hypothetical protein
VRREVREPSKLSWAHACLGVVSTLALLVTTPARADMTRAELEALAESERLATPAPSAKDAIVARLGIELRGGGLVAPGRGSGGGMAFRAGARFGSFALDAQVAISLLGGGQGPLVPTFDATEARNFAPTQLDALLKGVRFSPSYASGVGVFVPTSVVFVVIPHEALELGAGPSIDILRTTSASDVLPYLGFAGRMALRLDVRSNAESRKWLLTLGLSPHLTLADVPLLSLHGSVGATWE